MLEKFRETADEQPEILAHHFAQAGNVPGSIQFLSLAGQRALARPAIVEAVGAFTRALEALATLPPSSERDRQENRPAGRARTRADRGQGVLREGGRRLLRARPAPVRQQRRRSGARGVRHVGLPVRAGRRGGDRRAGAAAGAPAHAGGGSLWWRWWRTRRWAHALSRWATSGRRALS